MLHHISIAVNNPHHVASVLAEIMQGDVIPFPPNPGSYVALAEDEFGTMIEFYPAGTALIPNAWEGQAGFQLLTPAIAPKYLNVFSPQQLKELKSQLAMVDARR
jgi:hypothetical protein